jgi:hypothetical protein
LECGTAFLLYLIYEKGKHHEKRQNGGEILVPVSEVVLKLISLVKVLKVSFSIFHRARPPRMSV